MMSNLLFGHLYFPSVGFIIFYIAFRLLLKLENKYFLAIDEGVF